MTPFHKLIAHNPKKGQYGDCYRTAIACLLDTHPALVPHTMAGNDGRGDMRKYLAERELSMIELAVYGPHVDDVLAEMQRMNPDAYYVLIGKSPKGIGHCVICLGGIVVHDPNPDGVGVAAGLEDDMFFVQFLVPASMTKIGAEAGSPDQKMVAR